MSLNMAGVMAANNSVFNKRLKMSKELAERVCMERLFHIVGAAIEKALEAKAVLAFGTRRRKLSLEERSVFVGSKGVKSEWR